MESIDIWEVIGGLAYMALVVWPVRSAGRRHRLARLGYALRTVGALGYFGVVVVAAVLMGMGVLAGFSILYALIVYPVLTMWSVYRVQDIGWSRWWCLLYLIPPVALFFWILLLLYPGRPPPEPIAP